MVLVKNELKSYNSIQILQHTTNDLMLILGGKKWDHVTQLRKDLSWLPVSQRIIFKTALLVYKTLNGDGPAYLRDLLEPYTCGRQGMRSADNTTCLHMPATWCTTYGDRAFSVFGPKVWNSLPPHVQLSPSISSFKTAAVAAVAYKREYPGLGKNVHLFTVR